MEKDRKISNLDYFSDLVSGDKEMILEIIDTFLTQIVDESGILYKAIIDIDYKTIKTSSHNMKSTLSIVGAVSLLPLLNEIEDLAIEESNIETISEQTNDLKIYIKRIVEEIKEDRENYI